MLKGTNIFKSIFLFFFLFNWHKCNNSSMTWYCSVIKGSKHISKGWNFLWNRKPIFRQSFLECWISLFNVGTAEQSPVTTKDHPPPCSDRKGRKWLVADRYPPRVVIVRFPIIFYLCREGGLCDPSILKVEKEFCPPSRSYSRMSHKTSSLPTDITNATLTVWSCTQE